MFIKNLWVATQRGLDGHKGIRLVWRANYTIGYKVGQEREVIYEDEFHKKLNVYLIDRETFPLFFTKPITG